MLTTKADDVLHDPLNDASDSATASTKTAESGQPEKYQGDPMEHKDPAEQAQSAANELDNQMPWMIALLVNANKAYEAGRLETCLEICEDLLSNPYLGKSLALPYERHILTPQAQRKLTMVRTIYEGPDPAAYGTLIPGLKALPGRGSGNLRRNDS